MSGDTKFGII